MKKYFLSFFLVLIFSAFLTSNNVNAQDTIPPCEMDCLPQSPWVLDTLGQYTIPGCPSCTLSFTYWYRTNACGVFKDLQLGEITLSLACLSCPLSIKDFVDFAVDKMILYNEIPKPDSGKCDTYWRAINASCWGFIESGNDTVLKPCKPSECCWRTLTMCTDSSGNVTYSQHPPFTTPDICYIYPYPCTFVCDEMPQPTPTPSGLEETTNLLNGFGTLVYPNPGTDWFNIKFHSDSEGQHTIEVFDESGNLITVKDFVKVQGEIIIQLNMSSFSNGNYRYVIKHNDKLGISGSFNVVK